MTTWYREGMVTLTAGSDLVAGLGTEWVDNVLPGGIFFTPAGLVEVERVISDTSLKLVTPYGGATVAGAEYSIAPTQGYVVALAKQLNGVLGDFGELKDAWQDGTLVGKGVALKGVKDTVGELPGAGNSPGDAWMVDGHMHVWTGTFWKDQGATVSTPELEALRDAAEASAGVAVGSALAVDASRKDIQDRVYPGTYVSLPTTKPSGAPMATGDRAIIFFSGVPYEHVYLSGAWMIPNIDASNLALSTGAARVGSDTDGGTLKEIAEYGKSLPTYAALRSYTGTAKAVRIRAFGLAGIFELDATDTTAADNGGTIIVGAAGRRWKRSYSGPAHLSWFGVVSGTTVQTAQIKAWLDLGGSLYADKGSFVTRPMKPVNFSEITFHPQCELVAAPGFTTNEVLLDLTYAVGITIYGNGASVRMLKSEYTTGEWRHCVNMYSAIGVSIFDLKALDSGGDGFYVGGEWGGPSRNIVLSNCTGDNNRRQGLSVVNVINLQVNGGEYKNTKGTAPACGIDVESNPLPGYYLQNVNITGVKTFNNDGGGILVSPLAEGNPISVTIRGCTSEYDGGDRGAFSAAGVIAATKIQGFVLFEDCLALRPQCNGIVLNRWTDFAPNVTFRRIKMVDVASNDAKATIQQKQCGVLVRVEPGETYGTSYGHANFEDIEVVDTRAVGKTLIPVFLNNAQAGGKPFAGLRFRNIKHSGTPWLSTATKPFLVSNNSDGSPVPFRDCKISYADDWRIVSPSFTPNLSDCGAIISAVGNGTYPLPKASGAVDVEFSFEVLSTGTMNVPLSEVTDTMRPASTAAGKGITSNVIGSFITLKAEAGRWRVVRQVGPWTQIP